MPSRDETHLDPLLRVREVRVDDRVRAVASALRTVEEARADRASAEAVRARASAAARAVRQAEREVLETGGLTALDLSRADAWEARVRDEDRRLFDAVARAAEAEGAAIDDEAKARAALAATKADADVIAEARAAIVDAARRAAEAKAEEEAEEAWRRRG